MASKAFERGEKVFLTWKAKQKDLSGSIKDQMIRFRKEYLYPKAEEIRAKDESLLAEICSFLNLHGVRET